MTEPKVKKAPAKKKTAKVKTMGGIKVEPATYQPNAKAKKLSAKKTTAKKKAPAKRKMPVKKTLKKSGSKARQPTPREIGGVIRTTVRSMGNSAGIVLTREVLRELAVERGDAVFLVPGTDGSYSLTTHDPVVERQLEQAELTLSRYRNTLKKLAE